MAEIRVTQNDNSLNAGFQWKAKRNIYNNSLVLRGFIVVVFTSCASVFIYIQLTQNAFISFGYYKKIIGKQSDQHKIDFTLIDSVNATKYLIYRCLRSDCGGLGDRGRGIVAAYLWSLISNRTFGIEHKNPDLNIFLKENKIKWRLLGRDFTGLKVRHFAFMDKYASPKRMHGFEQFPEDIIYWRSNTEMVDYLILQTKYHKILPWLNTTSKADIYKFVLNVLFKPSEFLRKHLNNFALKVNNHALKCAHLRTGRNPSNPRDAVLKHFVQKEDIPMIVNFLKSGSLKKYKVFVASDSSEVKANVSKEFANMSVDTPGEISHVDRLHLKNMTSVFLKGIMAQIILAHCNVLFISQSGFSAMSAYLRNDSRNLFCMTKDHKSIVPCDRNRY